MASWLEGLQKIGGGLQGLANMQSNQQTQDNMYALAQNPQFASALAGLQNAETSRMNALQSLKGTTPSDVQTALWYQNASPELREAFNITKRSQQLQNLGNQVVRLGPNGEILTSYEVGINPNNAPELKGQQATAATAARAAVEAATAPQIAQDVAAGSARGKALGEAQAVGLRKAENAEDVLSLVSEAKALLPKATSGGLATTAKSGAQSLGISTNASKADARLKIIGTALTGYVPRFEGPQSDIDVATYKAAAGDVANTEIPREDRLAALDTIEKLNLKYARQSQAMPEQLDVNQLRLPPMPAIPNVATPGFNPTAKAPNGWSVEVVE